MRSVFSEFGLFHRRVQVEIRWLQALAKHPDITGLPELSPAADAELEAIIRDFSTADAGRIKEMEKTTNHDVKAVEYFIRDRIRDNEELRSASGFIHFACTSEDINNLSQGLMLAEARDQHLCPDLDKLLETLCRLAQRWAAQPMLARTHGQARLPDHPGERTGRIYAPAAQASLTLFNQVEISGQAERRGR